jgi:glyoxylase-like metal-dependent hydrolase (beta-lactamase superfamily II)
MKLYVMANGTAPDMPRESLVSTGAPLDPKDVVPIPIMTFLIDHPEGLVLYDTGWSKLERAPRPWPIADDETVLSRLKKIGVRPQDIRYVICSHLHVDHAGGLEDFKKSEIIVSDVELTSVARLHFLNQVTPPYIKADVGAWVRAGLKWRTVGDVGKIVKFLDGVYLLSFGSGHAFGMLGLLLELPKTGNIILTSDAIYCQENVGPPVRLPGIIRDPEGYKKTLNRILEIAQEYNARLWFGHDMAQFKTLVKSDQGYYE